MSVLFIQNDLSHVGSERHESLQSCRFMSICVYSCRFYISGAISLVSVYVDSKRHEFLQPCRFVSICVYSCRFHIILNNLNRVDWCRLYIYRAITYCEKEKNRSPSQLLFNSHSFHTLLIQCMFGKNVYLSYTYNITHFCEHYMNFQTKNKIFLSIHVGFIYPERSISCRSVSIQTDTNLCILVDSCLFMSIRVGFTASPIISIMSIDVGFIYSEWSLSCGFMSIPNRHEFLQTCRFVSICVYPCRFYS